jgi:hypothetical protein
MIYIGKICYPQIKYYSCELFVNFLTKLSNIKAMYNTLALISFIFIAFSVFASFKADKGKYEL